MSGHTGGRSEEVELVMSNHPQFLSVCDALFDQLDFHNQQHVSSEAAAASVSMFFEKLRASLTTYGIPLQEPSNKQVMALFKTPQIEPTEPESEPTVIVGSDSRSSDTVPDKEWWSQEPHWDTNKRLQREEFYQFYAGVYSLATVTTAQSAVHEYGPSALGGIVGVAVLKRALQAVPVVGAIVSPVLGLLPTVLVGPALGVAWMYSVKSGRLQALGHKLFPNKFDAPGK